MTENHFRSHFSPFQINTQLFKFKTKMATGGHFGSPIWDILDDRKSLSIAFLTISDQYAFLNFCSKWPPPVILEVRFAPKKKNRVIPLCVINGYAKYEVDR